jgi:hypothetical protein
MYREQAERQYRNFSMEQPYQHSMHNLNCMLMVVRSRLQPPPPRS